ncbi:hypothetical protein R6V09_45535 [Streptomyces sp. W16]|uniref:hypothetical protein n=1 Tax=Streptomyces sp. W16 TaxID=3076631 RepID=UPI00295BAAC7|nr:hypothetical protein [Streptomyces sp. W16]MDV9177379.1 hypothetical protein [Streptomyces sp. W16]
MKQAPKRTVLDLTAVQVVASALATVVGAVLASLLGVTGTIIGAAVVSTSATTGAAVFQHAFRRTGEGIRRRVPAVAMALTPSEERAVQRADARAAFALPDDTPAGATTSIATPSDEESVTTCRSGSFWKTVGWKKYALATGLVFALAMVTVTVGELVMGKPIAAAVRNESGNGTSIGGGSAGTPAPAHSPTPTPLATSGAGSQTGGSAAPSASVKPDTSSSSRAGAGQSSGSSPETSASTVPSASSSAVNSADATAR